MIRLENLSPGERFWIWQRRHGVSRDAAAKSYAVKPQTVTDWTRDRKPDVPEVPLKAELTPGEISSLYRRRAELGVRAAARLIGISHVTLIAREKDIGPSALSDVIPWWEAHYPNLGGRRE